MERWDVDSNPPKVRCKDCANLSFGSRGGGVRWGKSMCRPGHRRWNYRDGMVEELEYADQLNSNGRCDHFKQRRRWWKLWLR